MKLSTKIILPIIIISALLILLNGCFGVPADESPGFTPGTITGVIASPCCSTSAEPVSETCCIAPEYWCFYCQNTWSLQDGIEVVLTYGEDEVATTTTNDKGEFTFTNVSPGKNYVITAYCPDFSDNRPLVKDVALELIEGGSFDTKITDLVSTSLGLVVDFLVLYTELGPEDIILEGVIADKPNFPNFPKFKKLVYEVRRVLENCEVNMLTDDDLQDALCFASEEVGRETDPDLVIGCSPGYTPPPPPPGACDGNIAPSINTVLLDGTAVSVGETVHVVIGTPYVITVNATDDGIKDSLVYYASVDGVESAATTSNQITVTPTIPGTFEVFAFAHDGCVETKWGPVTVVVCTELEGLSIAIDPVEGTVCDDECATLGPVTISFSYTTPDLEISNLADASLTWDTTPTGISFNTSTGEVCLTGDPDTYTLGVTYEDECGETVYGTVDVTFELCCPSLDILSIAIDPVEGTVCDDECATLGPVTISFSDTTPDLEISNLADASLTWDTTPTGISFNTSTGEVCLTGDPDTYTLGVTYEDECGETVYGTVDVTFELCCPSLDILSIAIDPVEGTVCDDECATLGPVTISFSDTTPDLEISNLADASLTWDTTPTGISFNTSTGEVCLTGDPDTYTLGVTYEDECGETVYGTVDVTFELCCPSLDILSIAIDPVEGTVCDDECATLGPVTISFSDTTPDLEISNLADASLTWDTTPTGISFNTSTGEVCLTGDPDTYTLGVTYEDECGETVYGTVDVTFELCCPSLDILSIAIDPVEGTVCDDECATLGPVTISFSDTTPDLEISNLADASLTWDTTPTGISFNTSTGEVCLTGDPDTYTLGVTYEDECGETVYGTVDVTFELCCPSLDILSIAIDPVEGTVCDDECATLGPVTISFSDTTPDLEISNLADASLTWDTTPTGISFNTSTGEVCLTGDPDTYTLGVTYEDECGETVYGTVDVTFEDCCIDPILDFLEFRVKLPSNGADFENWTEMFGYLTNPSFDSNTFYYDVTTGESGSPKFGFKATGCDTLMLEYNWYRGESCTGDWLTGEADAAPNPLDDPPSWRPIVSAGIYPELDSENSLCNNGGNILKIKVTTTLGLEEIYTIVINRVVIP